MNLLLLQQRKQQQLLLPLMLLLMQLLLVVKCAVSQSESNTELTNKTVSRSWQSSSDQNGGCLAATLRLESYSSSSSSPSSSSPSPASPVSDVYFRSSRQQTENGEQWLLVELQQFHLLRAVRIFIPPGSGGDLSVQTSAELQLSSLQSLKSFCQGKLNFPQLLTSFDRCGEAENGKNEFANIVCAAPKAAKYILIRKRIAANQVLQFDRITLDSSELQCEMGEKFSTREHQFLENSKAVLTLSVSDENCFTDSEPECELRSNGERLLGFADGNIVPADDSSRKFNYEFILQRGFNQLENLKVCCGGLINGQRTCSDVPTVLYPTKILSRELTPSIQFANRPTRFSLKFSPAIPQVEITCRVDALVFNNFSIKNFDENTKGYDFIFTPLPTFHSKVIQCELVQNLNDFVVFRQSTNSSTMVVYYESSSQMHLSQTRARVNDLIKISVISSAGQPWPEHNCKIDNEELEESESKSLKNATTQLTVFEFSAETAHNAKPVVCEVKQMDQFRKELRSQPLTVSAAQSEDFFSEKSQTEKRDVAAAAAPAAAAAKIGGNSDSSFSSTNRLSAFAVLLLLSTLSVFMFGATYGFYIKVTKTKVTRPGSRPDPDGNVKEETVTQVQADVSIPDEDLQKFLESEDSSGQIGEANKDQAAANSPQKTLTDKEEKAIDLSTSGTAAVISCLDDEEVGSDSADESVKQNRNAARQKSNRDSGHRDKKRSGRKERDREKRRNN